MADPGYTPAHHELVMHRVHNRAPWSLVRAEKSGLPDRWGVTYLQFPERGEPSGGSSWVWGPECFRPPITPEEVATAHVYRTAARVKEIQQELVDAQADAAAAKRYLDQILPSGINRSAP